MNFYYIKTNSYNPYKITKASMKKYQPEIQHSFRRFSDSRLVRNAMKIKKIEEKKNQTSNFRVFFLYVNLHEKSNPFFSVNLRTIV